MAKCPIDRVSPAVHALPSPRLPYLARLRAGASSPHGYPAPGDYSPICAISVVCQSSSDG